MYGPVPEHPAVDTCSVVAAVSVAPVMSVSVKLLTVTVNVIRPPVAATSGPDAASPTVSPEEAKNALTVFAAVTEIVQVNVPVGVQFGDHPLKLDPSPTAEAVRVTVCAYGKVKEQVASQAEIPAGLEVTVPGPETTTVSG